MTTNALASPEFAITDDGGVISPFTTSMKAFAGRLFHTDHDLPHPLVMHARATRELDRALAAVIERVASDAIISGLNANASLGFEQARLWQEAVYRATELFDTYCAHIPAALGSKGDKTVRRRLDPLVAAAKQRRASWALMCNRLKHNHHVLTPHRTRYASGRTVDGFRVSKHDHRGALVGSPEFHKQVRAISYGVAARELLHDVLRTDLTASKMVGVTPGEAGSPFFKHSLLSLPSLESWPNYFETGQRNTVDAVLGGYSLGRRVLVPIREDSVQSAVNTGDGVTRTFEII